MILRKIIVLSALFSALGAFSGGCQSGGVGDPCTPEDEYQPTFSGFAATEVNVESRSFQCETRVCLVNHFRGRVSCPLGQDAEVAKKAADYSVKRSSDGGAKITDTFSATEVNQVCHIPGSSGNRAEVVQTSVVPQCRDRQADLAVYCSCRCAGSDPSAKYCECPSGFTCTPFPELDLGAAVAQGSGNLSGSYCVKDGDVDRSSGSPKLAYKATDCKNPASDSCTASNNGCGVKDNVNLK